MRSMKESAGCEAEVRTASSPQQGVELAVGTRTRPPLHLPTTWIVALGCLAWTQVAILSPWILPLPEHWSVTSHPWAIYLRLPLAAWSVAAVDTLMWTLSQQARAAQRKDLADALSNTITSVVVLTALSWQDTSRPDPPHTAFQLVMIPWLRHMCRWPWPVCSPPALLPLLPPPGWPRGILPAVGWALASCALLWLLVQGLPMALGACWACLQHTHRSRAPLTATLLPHSGAVERRMPLPGAMHLAAALAATATAAATHPWDGTWSTPGMVVQLLALGGAVCLYRGMVATSSPQHLAAAEEADANPEEGPGQA